MTKPSLLLIEEASVARELQVLALESQGWQVVALADVAAAASLMQTQPVLLVVAAAGALAAGKEALEALRRALEAAAVGLYVQAFPAEEEVVRRLALPLTGFFWRPLSLGGLVERVRRVVPEEGPPEARPLVLVADDDPVSRKLLQLMMVP